MKVAVIGGGPAGLVTLKFLAKAHEFFPIPAIEVRLFESEADIGGTFVYRVYEDAELVSSKYLTAFSDFRLPEEASDFVTPAEYVRYLNSYVDAFGLGGFIECNSRVKNICRGQGGIGHVIEITTKDGGVSNWDCDAVAVCSGIHVTPQIPHIPGIERVPTVLHSSKFKTRAQFGKDTQVVVLGAGETAMDIAHLAITSSTRSVTLCHRDGFFCAPKIVPTPRKRNGKPPDRPNKPVDASVASLFDTAYVHPVLQRSQLLWIAYDQWVKKMHWVISGTEEGPDQWVGQISESRKNLDSIFLCKSDRALPYISAGRRSKSLWNRVRSSIVNVPIKETHGRQIDVMKWPLEVDEGGYMCFDENDPDNSALSGEVVKPDVVIFATGYQAEFPFLNNDYPGLCHANIRGVYKSGDVSVGFIGFVRPSIGAIPPLAEMQAQLWVLRLLQDQFPNQVPTQTVPESINSYELDYKLHSRCGYDFSTSKRGVDHESYAYQLALDIGSAPKISYIMGKGWKLFYTWAMGSNFNTKFRLIGPWKWEPGAEQIMRGELYNVVKRSGGYLYLFTYTIVPFIIFGTISSLLHAGTALADLPVSMGLLPIKDRQKSKECLL